MTAGTEGMMTVREVAARTRRSPETVRRWIWHGKLPATKVGNQLFIAPRDLEQKLGGAKEARIAEQLAAIDQLVRIGEAMRSRISDDLSAADEIELMREERMQQLLRTSK